MFPDETTHRCNRWLLSISCRRMSDISPKEDDRLLKHSGSGSKRKERKKKKIIYQPMCHEMTQITRFLANKPQGEKQRRKSPNCFIVLNFETNKQCKSFIWHSFF